MPCSPNDVSLKAPDFPSGPAIPGFGVPFALKVPQLSKLPDGKSPTDLNDLFKKINLLIPPGNIKPNLSPNFTKNLLDTVISVLDKFLPFLFLYKFFLPLLNLVVCVIEVLCAIPNPAKLIKAMKRLFRNCIPEFLNLFPFASIFIMLFSLLLILIQIVSFIVEQVLLFVKVLTLNINTLAKAYQYADAGAVSSIARKIGSLLCSLRNFLVILAFFNVIISAIKEIINFAVSIPPCDSDNQDGCCTTDVCPSIVQSNYTRITGKLQYLNQVSSAVPIPGIGQNLVTPIRAESWQFYDPSQTVPERFINIVDGYDVTVSPKPVFFPTDSLYTKDTAPNQAAYTLDLRLYYNPVSWGRTGVPRFIKFKDCIVLNAPTTVIYTYNNSTSPVPTGSFVLAGGKGYEDDGTTPLKGYDASGIVPIDAQATLNNFLHLANYQTITPILSPTDGYLFSDAEYTFKPNFEVLLGKNLVTAGCEPSLAINKNVINQAFAGDVALKTSELSNLLNGSTFPDANAAQECIFSAIDTLRNNLTTEGVTEFQNTTTACLDKLKSDAEKSLLDLITLGVDPCKSKFALSPTVQFTTKPIAVTVNLNDKNGSNLAFNIPVDTAAKLSEKIKAYPTLGEVSKFEYDGYQSFTANLTSKDTGSGQMTVSFNNNMFCTNNIPENIDIDPSIDLQVLDYQFVYAPVGGFTISVGEGDQSDGSPRRDAGDLAKSGNSKDNV